MITLISSLALSFAVQANPFTYLSRAFGGQPLRMTIAPCEGDYACVEAGGERYAMIPVGIARDGYEIIAVAAPGQPTIVLLKTQVGQTPELVLLFKDGGQIFGFHPDVNQTARPDVPANVLAEVKSAEFRHYLTARTEDQVKARAESLVKHLKANGRAPINVTRETILEDVEHLFESNFVSQETLSRVRAFMNLLHADQKPASEPKAVRKHLNELSDRFDRDMKACGFSQGCAKGV